MVRARYPLLLVATGLVLCMATGCGKQGSDPAAPEPAVAAKPVPINIEEVFVGNAGIGASRQPGPLTPNDDIHVVLKTNPSSREGALDIRLFDIGNGKEVGARRVLITADHSDPIEVAFHNNGAWASGRYMVEIKIDGKLAAQRDFDVIDLPAAALERP